MPTVAEILEEHVSLDVECFDRLYFNGYVPILQTGPQMVAFPIQHRGNMNASGALPGQMTRTFVRNVENFASHEHVPLITFKPRVMSLMAALSLFLHVPNGFRHRDLRPHVAHLMGLHVLSKRFSADHGCEDVCTPSSARLLPLEPAVLRRYEQELSTNRDTSERSS